MSWGQIHSMACNMYVGDRDLCTGFEALDAEHQELQTLMEKVETTILLGGSQPEVLALLDNVIMMADAHFGHEEATLEPDRLLDMRDHRSEHAELLRLAHTVRKKVASREPAGWLAPYYTFMNRMIAHVAEYDVTMGAPE